MTITTQLRITESDVAVNIPELPPSREPARSSDHQGCINKWTLTHASQEWVVHTTRTNMTRQMSSFGRKIPTFYSLGVQGTNTSRAHSPAVPSLFLLIPIYINKNQWIPSLTMCPLTRCYRMYEYTPKSMMYVCQTLNLNLNAAWYFTPSLQKYRGQRTTLNLVNETPGMQSAKTRHVQNYRTRERFSFTNKLQGKKENGKEVVKAYILKRFKDKSTQCGPCRDFNKLTVKIIFLKIIRNYLDIYKKSLVLKI